ncbi:hypothetical protein KM043_014977 [Ampulex compressa]|nr:hypothetical protein KM043_014977 [Ampulex compressa]
MPRSNWARVRNSTNENFQHCAASAMAHVRYTPSKSRPRPADPYRTGCASFGPAVATDRTPGRRRSRSR